MIRHMNAEYRAARVLGYAGLGIALALAAGAALAQSAPASPTAYSVKQLPPDCRDDTIGGIATKHCGGLHFRMVDGRYAQVKLARNGRDWIVKKTAYSVKQLPPDCNAEFVRGVEYQHCGGLHMKQEGDRWVQVYTH